MFLVDLFVLANEFFQLICGQVGVLGLALYFFLIAVKCMFEMMVFQGRSWAHHDVAEHVDETTVAVPAGSRVVGLSR